MFYAFKDCGGKCGGGTKKEDEKKGGCKKPK